MRVFDKSIGYLALFAALLSAFVMLSISTEVVMRAFWNRPIIWVVDICEYIIVWITFLGAAWVLKNEGHVKMDLVLGRLNPRTQRLLNITTSIIGAIICLAIAFFGIWVTWDNILSGAGEEAMVDIPKGPLLSIIPVGSFLLFIQFLRRASGYMRSPRVSSDKEQRL